MSDNPTRWAIAGTGKISGNFADALNLALKSEHVVVAVASRSLERAQTFAKSHNIPQAFGSYEEMAIASKDNNIDVVYIGTVHPSHKPISEIFINAGIAVLAEKPLTVNAREARAVIDLARERNVFLMEGHWSRFFPSYIELRKELEAGTIGEPQFVSSNFGINLKHLKDDWVFNKEETAGGSLLSLGFYNVHLAQIVFNYEKPEKIVATGIINEKTGVDESLSVTLVYSNGRMAVLNSSITVSLDPVAIISGSVPYGGDIQKGIIKLPKMWCPTEMITPGGTKHFPLKYKSPVPLRFSNGEGVIYEADAVRDCLLKGLKEHPLCTWEQTIQNMEILDEIRRQIGLEYKWDKQ